MLFGIRCRTRRGCSPSVSCWCGKDQKHSALLLVKWCGHAFGLPDRHPDLWSVRFDAFRGWRSLDGSSDAVVRGGLRTG